MNGVFISPARLDIVTPPAGDLVTLAEAAAHANVPADDPALPGKLAVASERIEGPNGFLGKYLRRTTLKAVSPDAEGYLSAGPWYLRLPGGTVDRDNAVANIVSPTAPVPSVTVTAKVLWLQAGWYARIDSFVSQDSRIEVTYRVGGEEVPAPVKEAVMKLTAHLMSDRGLGPDMGSKAAWADVPALVAPYADGYPWE